MKELAISNADSRQLEALRRAQKKVREIRSFYISVALYAVFIPIFWIVNLMTGDRIWAHWPMIAWGVSLVIHGMSVFASGSFFGPAWQEKKVEEIMARENLKLVSREKQLIEVQMRLLQAQIEPHFLFNTLANIQRLIGRSPDKAQLMMDNFIAYLRQTLSASRAQMGTVKQEFDLLGQYLDLIKIRMADRLEYDLQLDATLEKIALAPMLLQPIVENAVKHGLEPNINGGRVTVSATREKESMMLSVTDNGLGFSDNADSKGTGVGLTNLRERLAMLYDNRATLTIADANPGTRIVISVPLSKST
jgi:LytS/YehU family sensor histidine kinase